MQTRQINVLVCTLVACWHAHSAPVDGGVSGGRGGDLPCYYQPTIVYGPPCSNPNVFHPISPRAINSAGQVAGYIGGCLGGPDNAIVWTSETGIVTAPPPANTNDLEAEDIIDDSSIIGFAPIAGSLAFSGSGRRGFVYDWSVDMLLLQPLPGDNWAEAHALNDRRTMVGFSNNTGTGPQTAVLWNTDQALQIPGLLGPNSEATDINDLGEITGEMGLAGIFGDSHGFLWQNGRVIDMGIFEGASSTHPSAINNNQQIVGENWYVQTKPDLQLIRRAFTWSDGTFTELPLLPGFESCRALDVNDNGIICGECEDADVFGHVAVAWIDGTVHELFPLIPQDSGVTLLHIAWAINNQGVIAATGNAPIGDQGAGGMILLTPVYPVTGDLNCDEVVNVFDLSTLLAQWGSGDNLAADFNGDGVVGPFDLGQLLANWGSSPETKGGS